MEMNCFVLFYSTDRIHRIPMFCTWVQRYHDIEWYYPIDNVFGSILDRHTILVLEYISLLEDCFSLYYLILMMRRNVKAFERDDWRHECVEKTISKFNRFDDCVDLNRDENSINLTRFQKRIGCFSMKFMWNNGELLGSGVSIIFSSSFRNTSGLR